MNQIELVGMLLQDLRDNHGPDEEDLDLAVCREMCRIFDLIVEHGHLARDMFDLTGIGDPETTDGGEELYARYRTTNYPINYGVFADGIVEWLLGRDERERLTILDLVAMIKGVSSLRIEIVTEDGGSMVLVRSHRMERSNKVVKRVFIEH